MYNLVKNFKVNHCVTSTFSRESNAGTVEPCMSPFWVIASHSLETVTVLTSVIIIFFVFLFTTFVSLDNIVLFNFEFYINGIMLFCIF